MSQNNSLSITLIFKSLNFQYVGWANAIDTGTVPDDLADFLDKAEPNVKSED